jgi:hypothetical protein
MSKSCTLMIEAEASSETSVHHQNTWLHIQSHEKLRSQILPFKACWLLDGPTGLTFKNIIFCRHSISYLSQNKQQILTCITQNDWFYTAEIQSVYCWLPTGSLNITAYASSLNRHRNCDRAVTSKRNVIIRIARSHFSKCNCKSFFSLFIKY